MRRWRLFITEYAHFRLYFKLFVSWWTFSQHFTSCFSNTFNGLTKLTYCILIILFLSWHRFRLEFMWFHLRWYHSSSWCNPWWCLTSSRTSLRLCYKLGSSLSLMFWSFNFNLQLRWRHLLWHSCSGIARSNSHWLIHSFLFVSQRNTCLHCNCFGGTSCFCAIGTAGVNWSIIVNLFRKFYCIQLCNITLIKPHRLCIFVWFSLQAIRCFSPLHSIWKHLRSHIADDILLIKLLIFSVSPPERGCIYTWVLKVNINKRQCIFKMYIDAASTDAGPRRSKCLSLFNNPWFVSFG